MLCLGGRFIAWGAVFCVVGFVDAVAVVLPERVVKVLRGRLESEGRTIEEFVGEAVLEKLDIVDPDVRVEFHLKLCEKYLRECEYRGRKIGVDMCADPYILYLAYKRNANIVTSDRRLAELASRIGITTIYPVSRRVKIEETVYAPKILAKM